MPHGKPRLLFRGTGLAGLLTRHKACFHPSPGKRKFALSLAPMARFHLIPNEWLFIQRTTIGKRNPASGWTKSGPWPVEILTAFGRNLCAAHTNDEAPKPFGFGASFTLAAIYSRGTCRPTTIDVLMFHFRVRNGTGWDHQAMTTRFQGARLCSARCLPR